MIRPDVLNDDVQHAGPSFSFLLRSWEASCHFYSKALCKPWVTSTAYNTLPQRKNLRFPVAIIAHGNAATVCGYLPLLCVL